MGDLCVVPDQEFEVAEGFEVVVFEECDLRGGGGVGDEVVGCDLADLGVAVVEEGD